MCVVNVFSACVRERVCVSASVQPLFSSAAYLPHHSSLSILGNAFLASSLLAAAESPEWPGCYSPALPLLSLQSAAASFLQPGWGSGFRWQGWVQRGRGEQNITRLHTTKQRHQRIHSLTLRVYKLTPNSSLRTVTDRCRHGKRGCYLRGDDGC